MSDPVSTIRHDHAAKRDSGTRPLSSIRYIVWHDAEVDDPKLGAEKVADYFASAAAKGSTHFGVDNDTTQRYLADDRIPWGAPGANTHGLHIECMGVASHSREKWLEHHGPMFDRLGWLTAHLAKQYDIPLRILTPAEFRAGQKGIVTHRVISAADGPGGSTHTDPGAHFPLDVALAKARHYAGATTSTKPQPYPLEVGHVFASDPKLDARRHDGRGNAKDKACVKRIQKAVGAHVDGIYGDDTTEAVAAYQHKHRIDVSSYGVVGPRTWRHITKG